jgi:hypothetical protein
MRLCAVELSWVFSAMETLASPPPPTPRWILMAWKCFVVLNYFLYCDKCKIKYLSEDFVGSFCVGVKKNLYGIFLL